MTRKYTFRLWHEAGQHNNEFLAKDMASALDQVHQTFNANGDYTSTNPILGDGDTLIHVHIRSHTIQAWTLEGPR